MRITRNCIRNRINRIYETVMLRIDTTKYIIDSPKSLYQPLPWIGINEGRRARGSMDRMVAIKKMLLQANIPAGVALDIGCNCGYFSLSLAAIGYFVYGVDSD